MTGKRIHPYRMAGVRKADGVGGELGMEDSSSKLECLLLFEKGRIKQSSFFLHKGTFLGQCPEVDHCPGWSKHTGPQPVLRPHHRAHAAAALSLASESRTAVTTAALTSSCG